MEYTIDRKRLILELAIALVFVALLLILSISVIKNTKQQEKEIQVENLVLTNYYVYNTYVYAPSETKTLVYPEKASGYPRIHGDYHNYYEGPYPDYENSRFSGGENREKISTDRSYSYFGQKTQEEDFLGGYVNEYRVYVLNREKTGEYFTVTFRLRNMQGSEYSESITKYVRGGERELFLYKDVLSEKRENILLGYDVEKE